MNLLFWFLTINIFNINYLITLEKHKIIQKSKGTGLTKLVIFEKVTNFFIINTNYIYKFVFHNLIKYKIIK